MLSRRKVPIGRLGGVVLAVLFGAGRAEAAIAWETGQYREVTPQVRSSPAAISTRSLAPSVTLSYTVVQRPRVSPGEVVALRAEYEVTAPQGSLEVTEIRIIRFEGQQVAKVKRVVAHSSGPVASDYYLTVPPDAAPGWYTVETSVEPKLSTGAVNAARTASSAFYVQSGAARQPSTPRPDDERLRIKLWAEKQRYKVGDAVKVFFESSRDAYVTLVNIGTSGRITILYPNKFSSRNAVKARTTYSVPGAGEQYKLTLGGPAGVELVYALVTLTPTRFIETDFSKDAFPTVNHRADVLAREINATVRKIPLNEQATAAVEIEVTP